MIKRIVSFLLNEYRNILSTKQKPKNQRNKNDFLVKDDFNWKEYHRIYGKQLSELSKIHTQILKDGDYVFKNKELIQGF